jgi:hypothetical protein
MSPVSGLRGIVSGKRFSTGCNLLLVAVVVWICLLEAVRWGLKRLPVAQLL